MPVTSRKLLVANISGAGKKAPNNLKYDHIRKRVINITCFCKPVVICCPDDTDFDAGNALSDYQIIIEDDGTGLGVDAGNAQTESCS
jgi:hypothetical protein